MPPFDGPLPPGLPGAPGGAPPGAMPQSLSAAPAHTGPGTPPSGNPGNTMQGLHKIGAALKLLQEALPSLPMGTPAHADIMKFLISAGKHIESFKTSPQGQKMALLQQLRSMQSEAPNAALQRLAPPQAPTPPAMGSPAPPPQG